MVAGHSVGELAAWAAACGILPQVAIEAAARRGALMAREAALHPGGMLALDGDAEVVRAALEYGRRAGALGLACVNAPDRHVLSGDAHALAAVAAAFPSQRLRVAGAWHSPAMAGALDELRALLDGVAPAPLRARFVCNRTGRLVNRAAEIPRLIAEQLVHPVEWAATMRALDALGVTDYVTVGAGRILRGLVRRNLPRARVHTTEDAADLARTVEALAA